MLSKAEIKELHEQGMIHREGKLAGKIPFMVRTFRVKDNLNFAKSMDELEVTDSNLHIQGIVAYGTLKGCLVSFNGDLVSKPTIDKFTPEKANFIIDFWKKFSKDLTDYLEGFSEQELTETELEEFILTDTIIREENFEFEEGVSPLKIKYKIIPVGEMMEVTQNMREILKQKISKIHARAATDRAFAAASIISINGTEVNEDTIDDFNIEMINFILKRANSVEGKLREYLKTPEKMGEALKN